MQRIKAIGLTSGGLDSTLAALVLKHQGIEVVQVCFRTPFFGDRNARDASERTGIPLIVTDITDRYLDMLAAPKHGFGRNMNPCIDCHTLMVRIAGELMGPQEAHFVFTGEVLGQRPMSQTLRSLAQVARESGIGARLLRPLSARCLAETFPEEQGWVDRSLLPDFKGRSRKPQIALAEELGLESYPAPAGGCRLTEEVFSRRLRDLFTHRGPRPEVWEMEILKTGRHFRMKSGLKLVVGRDKEENDALLSLTPEPIPALQCADIPGPVVLVPEGAAPGELQDAADLAASYGDVGEGEEARVVVLRPIGGPFPPQRGRSRPKAEFAPFII